MERSLPGLQSLAEKEIQHPFKPAVDPTSRLFGALKEINERCLEAMAVAARAQTMPAFPLSAPVRELLRSSSPEAHRRAASRRLLLFDMRFRDAEWWRSHIIRSDKSFRSDARGSSFPRRVSVALARSALVLAWSSANSDPQSTRIVFGMTPEVVQLIGDAPLRELDCIADRHYRCVQPRWIDRPWVWRALLEAAETGSAEALLAVDLHALQLMTGDFLLLSRGSPSKR